MKTKKQKNPAKRVQSIVSTKRKERALKPHCKYRLINQFSLAKAAQQQRMKKDKNLLVGFRFDLKKKRFLVVLPHRLCCAASTFATTCSGLTC